MVLLWRAHHLITESRSACVCVCASCDRLTKHWMFLPKTKALLSYFFYTEKNAYLCGSATTDLTDLGTAETSCKHNADSLNAYFQHSFGVMFVR